MTDNETKTTEPAVMPDFADATGLDALLAAGGRSAGGAARSHGDAGAPASPPAAPISTGPTWPPPPTPELFKVLVRQLDTGGSMIATLVAGAPIAPEEAQFIDQVADGVWPLAYYYGAGGDRPSKGMLWMYAIASLLGLVSVKLARLKAGGGEVVSEGVTRPPVKLEP